jgi:hypothetical protein
MQEHERLSVPLKYQKRKKKGEGRKE